LYEKIGAEQRDGIPLISIKKKIVGKGKKKIKAKRQFSGYFFRQSGGGDNADVNKIYSTRIIS
jgi:hypothetical protein